MSKKPSRLGLPSTAQVASRNKPAPDATSDKVGGAGPSMDQNSSKSSRSSDTLPAAQEVSQPPPLHQRHSGMVSVLVTPSEANDLSSVSRRPGAVQRQQRSPGVVLPHSPGDRETATMPVVTVSATGGSTRVPKQPGEPRRSAAAGPATRGGTPSEASLISRRAKEAPSLPTSDLNGGTNARVMPDDRRRTGGTDGRPLDEGLVRGAFISCT
ncbi:hypothetical protein HPB51_019914 [Rhipicephalus microplus]|uniref:Uncharacterized protein n=1 Tax=Rhipicephalus microplus TaxID=6941 RepID=A0A9J6E3C0_RHIMP|nr:hypothetical protein HPB51_019914 [Rhipicephalus microplus]